MHSERNPVGTVITIILVIAHFFGMVLLMMSTPVGALSPVKLGARLDLCCLLSALIQLLYCLLRPSFSQLTKHHHRYLKPIMFAVTSLVSLCMLLASLTVLRGALHIHIVQVSSAAIALTHAVLYFGYARLPLVFLPFWMAPDAAISGSFMVIRDDSC